MLPQLSAMLLVFLLQFPHNRHPFPLYGELFAVSLLTHFTEEQLFLHAISTLLHRAHDTPYNSNQRTAATIGCRLR